MNYLLCHKDIETLLLDFDSNGSFVSSGEILNELHLPISIQGKIKQKGLNRATQEWWESRSIPSSRQNLKQVLDLLGVNNLYLLKKQSFGLSLSDHYWIKPINSYLTYKQVNFFENSFSEELGNFLFLNSMNRTSKISPSPELTTDGWLKKRWKIINNQRILLKGSSNKNNAEAYNEVFAYKACELLNIECTPYSLINANKDEINPKLYSACPNFIDLNTELVSALDFFLLRTKTNNESDLTNFLELAKSFNMPNVLEKLSNMMVLDYLIRNEDRHYCNFGFLRNPNTLEWIGVAPLFDNGTSMNYCYEKDGLYNIISKYKIPFGNNLVNQIKKNNCYINSSNINWNHLNDLNKIANEVYPINNKHFNTIKLLFSLRTENLYNHIFSNQPLKEERYNSPTGHWDGR